MQMKCFLPEPRFPLEPCTVANGAGTAAMRERRQLRLPGAWSNWWHRSSFRRQWASMRVVFTWTVVVLLLDARHRHQRSGCPLRSFVGSSGQYLQNSRVRVRHGVRSPPAEAVCSLLAIISEHRTCGIGTLRGWAVVGSKCLLARRSMVTGAT